ncbi:hypothetical protein P5673_022636 [Acropora cervicornis]|uniref:Uncharacterized protein n=1 Tax=Acropora cervicornis TaxID=6130 RepID=A0AAD9Q6H2_ACRCE|nr:hypothetical protein P5673_022636 [Acropora cervicornis]
MASYYPQVRALLVPIAYGLRLGLRSVVSAMTILVACIRKALKLRSLVH